MAALCVCTLRTDLLGLILVFWGFFSRSKSESRGSMWPQLQFPVREQKASTIITVRFRSAYFWSTCQRRHIWALHYSVPTIPLCVCVSEWMSERANESTLSLCWVWTSRAACLRTQTVLNPSNLLWIKQDDGATCCFLVCRTLPSILEQTDAFLDNLHWEIVGFLKQY